MNQLKELYPKDTSYRFLKIFFSKIKTGEKLLPDESIIVKKGSRLTTDNFKTGEVLFVKKGRIQVMETSENGNKKILGIFNAGALLENVSASGLILCSAAVTLMDSELIFYTKEMLADIVKFS